VEKRDCEIDNVLQNRISSKGNRGPVGVIGGGKVDDYGKGEDWVRIQEAA